MDQIEFEWDEAKDARNRKVHGVSFAEAQTAFYDEYARLMPDPEHSLQEERFVLLGYSTLAKLLLVSHCYRGADEKIRIISARRADRDEAEQYHAFRGE